MRLLSVLLIGIMLSSIIGVYPVMSQDAEPVIPEIDPATLPILFEDDFEDSSIDPDEWAYDIREIELFPENDEETNFVMQIGHNLEWSEATLIEGYQWRNYIVEMDVKLLQYVDGSDNFFLAVRHHPDLGEYAVSLDLARRMVSISSTVEDVWQGISNQTPLVLDLTTWYRLRVHVIDDYIGFFVNDEFIAQVNSDATSEGSIRLLTAPGSFVQVDNVIIREIPSSAEEGDLLLTEFQFRENSPQWFELYNDSTRYIDLTGLEITNGTDSIEIDQERLLISPRSYMIFAQQPMEFFPEDALLYIFGEQLRFPADNGYFALRMNDETITHVDYSEDTNWPLQDNVSTAIHPDYLTRRRQNNGLSWCLSVNKLQDTPTMRGTPGEPNHVCVRELPLSEHSKRQHGDLIITEVMAQAEGPDQGHEWFEIYNPKDTPVSLAGLTFATDKPTERHTITENVVIPPHTYAVFAQAGLETSNLPPELSVYYYPGNFKISNEDGELTIFDGERVIDTIAYRYTEDDWWPIRANVSMTLHPDAISVYGNDDALNWCLGWTPISSAPHMRGTPGAPNDPCPMWEINSPMKDVPEPYQKLKDSPITIRITIDPKHLESMKTNPFSDVVYPMHFEADEYEATGTEINGDMRPRGGRGTRSAGMFSYRIHLTGEPFMGKETLRLSKHLGDPSRLRNSLAFNLFREMDGLVSLTTQFVHLYINGEDQGLYTMIENPNRSFLRDHRLDDRGNLFKVVLPSGVSSFMYYRDSDRESRIQSILATAQFESAHNHDGLIEMIDALYSDRDINEVIERHFNLENLLTYFSAVYLIQNRDTRVQNYNLYSTPREPYRVYFLPWDWDNGFQVRGRPGVFVGRWREGLGNWVGIGIFDRLLEDPDLVDAFILRMVELAETDLSAQRVDEIVDRLVKQVEPFTKRSPENYEMTPESLADEVAAIKTVMPTSASMLIETIEWPLPVRADGAEYIPEENAVVFRWQKTFDLQNDPLTYEVVLFSERIWDEDNIVWRSPRTTHSSLKITPDDLPDEVAAGPYYWMVYVWDDDNNYNTSSLGTRGDIEMIVDLP